MKQTAAILLLLLFLICFYHYLLGLLHLESLILTGGFLFLTLFLIIRLLTWRKKQT
ncbi:MAG: hypothetical protein ABF651_06295 [Sporolactobacillus sp.]